MSVKTAIRRIVPTPLLSLALLALWLVLNRSLGAGHVLLGLLLGLAIPVLTAGLRPRRVRIRRPATIARLALAVTADALHSNYAVARRLLTPSAHARPAGFVHVPLDLRDPNGLAVLAMIVCVTPGTAWAELSLDRSVLLLHMLELGDTAVVVRQIKQRYERPLMRIFES